MEQFISDLRDGCIFHDYSNFNRTCGDPDQTPRTVASDLVLHCLPTYHKKDDMLISCIWAKTTYLPVLFMFLFIGFFNDVTISAGLQVLWACFEGARRKCANEACNSPSAQANRPEPPLTN